MTTPEINVITGAFSYTGKYITRRLLAMGKEVRTLTGHPNNPNPFGDAVTVFPFDFDKPRQLVKHLQGATTLYNTYWIRFARGSMTFDKAVEHTKMLIRAAEEAGVQRIVHVSITNPAETSRLPYFRGKTILEQAIFASTLSYAIIRPTVIFGDEDILINNIAWLLRRFPVFPIFGSGQYRLQPIYVEDMADIVVTAGQSNDNQIIDAVGPDIFTFEELVRLIARKLHRRVLITHVRPELAFSLARLIEPVVGDVLITRDEVTGLMADLLISQHPPTGHTRLGNWLDEHAATVGKHYASELNRHYR
ncbi:MAG TPA: NAD(P)H-binding protein [Ktedonobacteraceae bacterium]|nr:NAD(P)H-binding protein [Ktedonobacteraceae bacterium]